MATNPDVMRAIMALDAYNRGYNRGLDVGVAESGDSHQFRQPVAYAPQTELASSARPG